MLADFAWVRDLFEIPAATAKRLLDAERSSPVDPSVLTDDVLQNVLLRLGLLEAAARTANCAPKPVQALWKEALKRKLPGVCREAGTSAYNVFSALYEILDRLMAAEPAADLLEIVADAERRLLDLPANLPPQQAREIPQLRVEFAERRAQILAALGLGDDANLAFLDALQWAARADAFQSDGRRHRRTLTKYVDWLARTDADQALRVILPVIANDSGENPPDADSLSLQCLLATFFQRHGDRLEATIHIDRMIADLERLGFRDSISGDYRDILPEWAARVREASLAHVERHRLLNQVFVCYVAINAHRAQGEEGAANDSARMLALHERLDELREVEHSTVARDAAFLRAEDAAFSGANDATDPDVSYSATSGPIDEAVKFEQAMQPVEVEDPPPEAIAALVAFANDANVQACYRARAFLRLALLALNAGRFEEAGALYEDAGQIANAHGVEDAMVEALKGAGLAYFVRGNYPRASEAAGAGVARVEAMRRTVSAPYLASAFMADKFDLYVLAINAARRAGDTGAMLARMELMKARALQERPGAIPPQARKKAGARLKALRDEAMAVDNDAPARQRLLDRRQAVWQELALNHVPDPPRFDLPQFQLLLGARTIALNYFFFDDNVLIVSAISRDRVLTERIAIPPDAPLFPAIEAFTRASNRSLGMEHTIAPLSAILLPSAFDAMLDAADRVVICAHQALHAVPFIALPWRGAPMIERFEVVCVPNLTCLLRPAPLAVPKGLFALAAEVCWPAGKHRPLTHAEPEARAAAAAWSAAGYDARLLTAGEASREALRRDATAAELARARIVHIGTHGSDVASADAARAPMECALYLADGPLDGMELSAMDLSAEVVVLAACHAGKRATSARGLARMPADAVYGLQAAFHAAGAHAILGGLWVVDDKCTPKITEAFYAAMARGLSVAAAFRAAIRHYHATAGPIFSEAAFWAPFTLIAFSNAAFTTPLEEEP